MKLSQAIAQYVELKQSMGARFHTEQVILSAFAKAMGNIDCEEVQSNRVYAYLAGSGPTTLFFHRKHQALSGFYRYAVGRGYVSSSPLPNNLPKPSKPFVPYIYSHEELQRLVDATASQDNPRRKLQAITLRTLLLVLYGAGLRLSEALHLTLADVDLVGSLLTIRETKFYKTRLVPIGPRLTAVLSTYATKRHQAGHSEELAAPFFVTRYGEPVTRQIAERSFVRLRNSAGVHRDDGARYQPRLHDLRHASTVHRLTLWYRQGANVQRLLPLLSTYLGRVHVASTQHYLTMTPELLQEASHKFERYAVGGPKHE
jgi:site-specific recombinase XerD